MKKRIFYPIDRSPSLRPVSGCRPPARFIFGTVSGEGHSQWVNREVFQPTPGDLRSRYGIGTRARGAVCGFRMGRTKGPALSDAGRPEMGENYRFVVIGLEQTQIDALPQGMLGLTRTRDTAELAAWYTAADCLANPTLEDNMPMVNLEALACGTPVAVFHGRVS